MTIVTDSDTYPVVSVNDLLNSLTSRQGPFASADPTHSTGVSAPGGSRTRTPGDIQDGRVPGSPHTCGVTSPSKPSGRRMGRDRLFVVETRTLVSEVRGAIVDAINLSVDNSGRVWKVVVQTDTLIQSKRLNQSNSIGASSSFSPRLGLPLGNYTVLRKLPKGFSLWTGSQGSGPESLTFLPSIRDFQSRHVYNRVPVCRSLTSSVLDLGLGRLGFRGRGMFGPHGSLPSPTRPVSVSWVRRPGRGEVGEEVGPVGSPTFPPRFSSLRSLLLPGQEKNSVGVREHVTAPFPSGV